MIIHSKENILKQIDKFWQIEHPEKLVRVIYKYDEFLKGRIKEQTPIEELEKYFDQKHNRTNVLYMYEDEQMPKGIYIEKDFPKEREKKKRKRR